jgi:hypothetical protein
MLFSEKGKRSCANRDSLQRTLRSEEHSYLVVSTGSSCTAGVYCIWRRYLVFVFCISSMSSTAPRIALRVLLGVVYTGAVATSWTAHSDIAAVTVDTESFAYNITVGGKAWLTDGLVAIQCGGKRFDSSPDGNLVGGAIDVINSTDPKLGPYEAVRRQWTTSFPCATLVTEVRSYRQGTIEFVTNLPGGANGTATESKLCDRNHCLTATEFPSLLLPGAPPPPPPPGPTPPPSPRPSSPSGCSDGVCDAFCEKSRIRGCAATWVSTVGLRAPSTGRACGNGLNKPCAAPIDACAAGWEPCLSWANGNDLDTFRSRVTSHECATGAPGAFVAAMSHVPGATCPPAPLNKDYGCKPQAEYGCEPICCGTSCAVPSCAHGVWGNGTSVLFTEDHTVFPNRACGNLDPGAATGVLCCEVGKHQTGAKQPAEGMARGSMPIGAEEASDTEVPGLLTWDGDALHGMYINLPQPANFMSWSGGLNQGPLVMYATNATNATAVAVLGSSSQFGTGILSRVGSRVVAGVQGMVTSLPPKYEIRFALVGRADGVTSAVMAYGASLRKAYSTSATKLRLGADPLSRQLHYVNDGGSLLNYCDYWPQCAKTDPVSCIPMGTTLKAASAYHKRIGLNVSVYTGCYSCVFWPKYCDVRLQRVYRNVRLQRMYR